MMHSPAFTISLDFELFWGVKDHRTLESYGGNILGARKAIPQMLEMFKQYNIHATWATVGFLFYKDKTSLLNDLSGLQPSYKNKSLSPYQALDQIGKDEQDDPYHFGSELIKLISSYSGQEIATHTYSHYYCLEEGQTIEQFRQDIQKAVALGKINGFNILSLVFPRNQFNREYLEVCKEAGIKCFRGNENSWIYQAQSRSNETLIRRFLRLKDAYVNISGHHTWSWEQMGATFPFNIPASRFLRPWSPRLSFLESLRLNRIKCSMLHAAKNKELFHLWWHPHNFGQNSRENLEFLKKILEYYVYLNQKYGMESLSMGEVADLLKMRRNELL